MPVQDSFQIPASPQHLPVPNDPDARLFVCFISSTDTTTGQPWCPDVRAALPRLQSVFGGDDAARLVYVHVGQKAEWKDLENVYRKKWNVRAVPQLVRYQWVDGEVRVTGQLVENEVNDDAKLLDFARA